MELDEKQFIAGFNSGYLLAKHEPEMITTLLKDIHPAYSYISGLSFGQKEFELSKIKDGLNELGKLRNKHLDEKQKSID